MALVEGESLVGTDEVVRVLICDDHAVVRRGLAIVLEGDAAIELVGEAIDGEEAVARAVELAPDVVLMDVRMPKLNGIEATRRIGREVPATKILMLTVSDEEDDLYEAVKAGASGYLLKDISIEDVAAAVGALMAGHSLITPSMAAKLLAEFSHLARQAEVPRPLVAPRLTDREVEVLRLVATGMSNREIGARLVIAENTVKNHVRNILEKLHLHTRTEAALYAVRQNIIELG
jgi:two-component system NarL family response regulator